MYVNYDSDIYTIAELQKVPYMVDRAIILNKIVYATL